MRVLMLGWEFPPFIAGGLGVACYGLTRALDSLGHRVTFVLPKSVDRSQSSHVRLLSPEGQAARMRGERSVSSSGAQGPENASPTSTLATVTGAEASLAGEERMAELASHGFKHAVFRGVTAAFASPYPGHDACDKTQWVSLTEVAAPVAPEVKAADGEPAARAAAQQIAELMASISPALGSSGNGGVLQQGNGAYGFDLVGDAERYARLVVSLTRSDEFDVIHAHDWLTFPAGVMLSRITGKPLLVHMHSTEFDRAGNNVNQRVYDIERLGMHAADRVLAVSQLTKNICERRYGVPADKIDVVYNGIERENQQPPVGADIRSADRIVLFLGRITMQKGPEYFIAAAKRVLEKVENVKFVIAGSGDMALRMVELAANMGIGHKVLFTGFLRGKDVERIYSMADCYVMPSVSEPFGLAALEAISHDVPVIVSKTSGVSEVLSHVLKVDFWDIDEMANKIIAVLRHPPLGATLREHGSFELQRLTWSGAAERCVAAYAGAISDRAGERILQPA
ncbi:MAG: glycosyltransferase [Phycisphaeraceae bacterium]|nr:glycosyltransferase [Phycisphaeraceae bacterium]